MIPPHMGPLPPALQPPPEYRDMAIQVLANAPAIAEFLNRCEGCGLPVADKRAELEGHVEFATNFLRSFFPEDMGS